MVHLPQRTFPHSSAQEFPITVQGKCISLSQRLGRLPALYGLPDP